jgi:hypothetical protein
MRFDSRNSLPSQMYYQRSVLHGLPDEDEAAVKQVEYKTLMIRTVKS